MITHHPYELQHYPWHLHGFVYDVKDLCEYLEKSFTLTTLESVSNNDVMGFAKFKSNTWRAR